jgi:hypothetical protein
MRDQYSAVINRGASVLRIVEGGSEDVDVVATVMECLCQRQHAGQKCALRFDTEGRKHGDAKWSHVMGFLEA